MSDFCRLHAGGVVRNGAAALLVGPSGAGKSTLVVRMVGAGFGLLSDDEVWLHSKSRLAHPTGRSLLLKDSAWDLFPRQRDKFVHTGEEGCRSWWLSAEDSANRLSSEPVARGRRRPPQAPEWRPSEARSGGADRSPQRPAHGIDELS